MAPTDFVDERYPFEQRNNLSVTANVTKVTGAQDGQIGAAIWSWMMDEYGAARKQFEVKLLGGK